jgi:hypothetical protein
MRIMALYYPWPNMIFRGFKLPMAFSQDKTLPSPPNYHHGSHELKPYGIKPYWSSKRKKKLDHSWVHGEPSHWVHEISISQSCFLSPFLTWSNGWHSQTRMPNYCDMVGLSLVFSHAFLCVHIPLCLHLMIYIFDSKMVTFINKRMGYYGHNPSLNFPK